MVNQNTNRLPTQEEFLEHGMVSVEPLQGSTCTICTSTLDEHDEVVRLAPCGHHFGKSCIISWFTSTHQARGTCPNDRLQLFEPNNLTQEQLVASQGPNENSTPLQQVERLSLRFAEGCLEFFNLQQHYAVTVDEIIDTWHRLAVLRVSLADWIEFLRQDPPTLQNDHEGIRWRSHEMAEQIEDELQRGLVTYRAALRAQFRKWVDSLQSRLRLIRVQSPNQPTIIEAYEERVLAFMDELSEPREHLYLGYQKVYRRLLGYISLLGMVLFHEDKPDTRLENAAHPGLSTGMYEFLRASLTELDPVLEDADESLPYVDDLDML